MAKKKVVSNEPETPFHTFTIDQTAQHYSTNTLEGLTSQEADNRLKIYGVNELQGNGGVKWYKVLWRQIANALVVILLIATVSLFVGYCCFLFLFMERDMSCACMHELFESFCRDSFSFHPTNPKKLGN